MARIFLRFPNGKSKTVTLSYDDGVDADIRLIEIMKKNGLKGTFNVNSGLYAPEGVTYSNDDIYRRLPLSKAQALYRSNGMEVAIHSLTHPLLDNLPCNLCTHEILQDRSNLEKEYGCIVRGMAYPYGVYNDNIVDVLKKCGIVYARTTKSTESFALPTDWLRLPATCHHNNPRLMELAESFLLPDGYGLPQMFYLWGHSYEFNRDNNWGVIEQFAEFIGNRENIWYATNIEIVEYVAAYSQLIFWSGSRKVFNPTHMAIWFCADGKTICVQSGETVEY